MSDKIFACRTNFKLYQTFCLVKIFLSVIACNLGSKVFAICRANMKGSCWSPVLALISLCNKLYCLCFTTAAEGDIPISTRQIICSRFANTQQILYGTYVQFIYSLTTCVDPTFATVKNSTVKCSLYYFSLNTKWKLVVSLGIPD